MSIYPVDDMFSLNVPLVLAARSVIFSIFNKLLFEYGTRGTTHLISLWFWLWTCGIKMWMFKIEVNAAGFCLTNVIFTIQSKINEFWDANDVPETHKRMLWLRFWQTISSNSKQIVIFTLTENQLSQRKPQTSIGHCYRYESDLKWDHDR